MKAITLGVLYLLFVVVPRGGNAYLSRSTQTNPRSVRCLMSRSNDEDDIYVEEVSNPSRRNVILNAATAGALGVAGVSTWYLFQQNLYTPQGYQRFPSLQFIAALGDSQASSGTGAEKWGVWREDPGPRGVWLKDYETALAADPIAPAGWRFNSQDWWLEEHGLIMESPQFPLPPGQYLVTGGRQVTTGLTIDGNGRWSLEDGTLYDVTHLPCRSARYQPIDGSTSGTPAQAHTSDFPVKPGARMPSVPGTDKQDYAVLFLLGRKTATP